MKPPSDIKFHKASQTLEVCFSEKQYTLSAEYLRQFSPSAEVRGHGGQPIQFLPGKAEVKIVNLAPVGQYAVRLFFDDGHNTGIYSWDHLADLGENADVNWQHYCEQLEERNLSRQATEW